MSRALVLTLGLVLVAGCSGSTPAGTSTGGSSTGVGVTSTGGTGGTGATTASSSSSSGGTTTTSGSAGTATLSPSLFTPQTVVSSYRVEPDGGINLDRLSVLMTDFALSCPQFQNVVADGGGATFPRALNLLELRFSATPAGPGTYPFFPNDGGFRGRGALSTSFDDGGTAAAFAAGGSAVLTSAGLNLDAVGTFETGLRAFGRATLVDGGSRPVVVDAGPLGGSFDAVYCQLPK